MAWSFHSISLCWEVIAGFLMLVGTPPPKSTGGVPGKGAAGARPDPCPARRRVAGP